MRSFCLKILNINTVVRVLFRLTVCGVAVVDPERSTDRQASWFSTVFDGDVALRAFWRKTPTMEQRATRAFDTVSLIAHNPATVQEVDRVGELAGINVKHPRDGLRASAAVLRLEEVPGSRVRVRASFHPAYAPYFAAGHIVLELPNQAEDLLELMLAAGSTRRGMTIGVIGAHGGAGTTTVACWIAALARGPRALIDLDPQSAGLLTCLGMAQTSGLRWPDIPESAGVLVPGRLSQALPSKDFFRVLSADERGAVNANGSAGRRAIDALSQANDVTILDLPRRALDPATECSQWLEWCDHLVLVAAAGQEKSMRQTRAALAALSSLPILAVRCKTKMECAAFGQEIGQDAHPIRELRNLDADIRHGLAVGKRSRSATYRDMEALTRLVTAEGSGRGGAEAGLVTGSRSRASEREVA